MTRATIGALGVVYGDIGTSPLYALKGATDAAGGATDAATVLGVLSLIFWSLFHRHHAQVHRADPALRQRGRRRRPLAARSRAAEARHDERWAGRFVALAALGTALFYCDALITPAISVLSARSKASSS